MYDKRDGCFRKANVATVAQERDFYSDEVEKKLNEIVETPANAAIAKFMARQQLDATERGHLAYCLATMMRRVPLARSRAQAMMPQILADTVQEVKELIGRAAAEGRFDTDTEAVRLAEADATAEKLQDSPPPEILERIRTPWPTNEMVALIYFMTWRFFTTDARTPFLTSDNPAFFFECYGLANQDSELTFPITSHLALHACWQSGREGEVQPLHHRLVGEFNKRVASSAERFVFSPIEADWIAMIARRRRDELSRINLG
jgi:hypothetical protein